jgi:hypothetical protein
VEHVNSQSRRNTDSQRHRDSQGQQLAGTGGDIRPGTVSASTVVLAGRGNGSFRGEAR